MNTLEAFARGQANQGRPHKVFDWDKAATLIVERGVKEASAGLSQDWEYTGGPILKDGKPVPAADTYVYLSSNWATPELDLNGDETLDCFVMQPETEWDAETYWPDSARAILEAGKR